MWSPQHRHTCTHTPHQPHDDAYLDSCFVDITCPQLFLSLLQVPLMLGAPWPSCLLQAIAPCHLGTESTILCSFLPLSNSRGSSDLSSQFCLTHLFTSPLQGFIICVLPQGVSCLVDEACKLCNRDSEKLQQPSQFWEEYIHRKGSFYEVRLADSSSNGVAICSL